MIKIENMKKFNTEITIDATADELQEIGITIPDYCGQAMRDWDFNTMTSAGPCAIRPLHDRQNRIARYFIKYPLITGKELTDDELIRAVEYVQNRL